MMRGKGFAILLILTAVVVAGAVIALREQPSVPQTGEALFPDLLAKVNDVVTVDITSAGEKFDLQRSEGGEWSVPARNGYAVTPDKVHKLLVGMANLQRLQPKTGKVERFEELGLRDPQLKESRAVGFSLRDGAGNALANLIVGERRPAKGDATRSEYFVRVPGEDNSWLVVGSLPDEAGEVYDWLSSRVASISGSRIARGRITHPDGEVVSVSRASASEDNYVFDQLPPGARPAEAWRINDIARLLTDLSLEDVKLATEVPADVERREFVSETFDGLRIRLNMVEVDETSIVTLRAEFDESLIPAEQVVSVDTAKIKDEVKMLNERWAKWAYEIPRYKADALRRRQSDLVRAPEAAS